ncbi:MAG: trans-sulfuration enzyme family protein [Lachnospiraceae bacterium]
MDYKFSTKCLYGNGGGPKTDSSGAISFPIYQTATFEHPFVGESTGYDYSRMQNPTREQLEHVIASLEYGKEALAFSSGMAAIACLTELFSPGDEIIADSDLYGGTIRLFDHILKKNQIQCIRKDLTAELSELGQYITERTKAIFIETPTNPMMHVIDIQMVADFARKNHLLLIVDNTFLTPYFQNPILLGADIVVHSGTKFLCGHNDTLSGFLITNEASLAEKLRFIQKTTGAGLAPFDSWLLLRGIKTLPLRMEQSQKNAIQISEWLTKCPYVTAVFYPGILGSAGFEIARTQARGFGSMITFVLDSKETALFILNHVKVMHYAESLGGVETLITYPITQTHADVEPEELAKNGITDSLLRISVGIEDISDLIGELERIFTELKANK